MSEFFDLHQQITDQIIRALETTTADFVMPWHRVLDQASELQYAIDRMNARRQGIIIGQTRLKSLNKRVGEAIKVSAIGGYKDLDLEFEIVGTFPPGRYDQSAVMNRDYLNAALDEYPRSHRGQKHAMADRSLNLVWVRVHDTASFSRVADRAIAGTLSCVAVIACDHPGVGRVTARSSRCHEQHRRSY